MGTVAEKLSYLAYTKDLFKDRLNSLGAEIIGSTTFRNYLNWLDTFYGEVSDKTDLAKNGVVGRTSQESTTGKNVFKKANDLYNNMRDTGQFTLADMGNNVLKATKNTTGTTSPRFYITDSIVSSTTYYVSLDALGNCNSLKVGIWADGTGQTDLATITPTSNYQKISFSFTSNGNITRIYFRNSDENIEVGQYFQIKNVMISTSSDTTYEPYTGGKPSPSPDYPQEINNLSGDVEYKVRGKNLFDSSSTSVYFINVSTGATQGSNKWTQSDYVKVLPNTTYVMSASSTLGTNSIEYNEYNNSKIWIQGVQTGSATESFKTFTTGNTTEYVRVGYRNDILTNIQLEKGNQATTYEPYISESFPLSLKSRNLFDKDNINVISAYISGSRVIASATVDKLIYIPCKPNTTYSLQKMPQETTNYNRFRIGTTTDTPALRMTVEDYFNAGDGSTLTNKTITTGANANYLVFYCYREDTLTSFEDMMSSIQIEEGLTATTYEPYYDINLCNISDYKDRIYSQNGEFYLEKKTGKVVLDGSENWTINTSYTYNVFYRTLDNYARISNTQTTYCEYYKGIENAGGIANFGNNYNNSIGVRTANDNIKDIYISNNSITSASDFKTWLSTHNTVVYYVLATPTTTKITQENYPTLYSQLLAIQEFLTKYKINKEFLLDYSSPEIEY